MKEEEKEEEDGGGDDEKIRRQTNSTYSGHTLDLLKDGQLHLSLQSSS